MFHADARTVSVTVDGNAIGRQLRFVRITAIVLTVVGGWALLWFLFLAFFGRLVFGGGETTVDPAAQLAIAVVGIVIGLVFLGIAVFMFVSVGRAKRRNVDRAIAVGADDRSVRVADLGPIAWQDLAHLIVFDYARGPGPGITLPKQVASAAVDNMSKRLGTDRVRMVVARSRDGREGRSVIGPYVDDAAFAHLMQRLQFWTAHHRVPFTYLDHPQPIQSVVTPPGQ